MVGVLFVWFAASFMQEGGNLLIPALFGVLGFLIGGLVVLSMKSIDW